MMLNYCSDTLSLKNRIDFPRTFRIKKESDISIGIYRFRIFFFSTCELPDYQLFRCIAEHDGINTLWQIAEVYS